MLTIFSGHLVDPYRLQEVGITMIQTPPVLSVAVKNRGPVGCGLLRVIHLVK